MVPSQIPLEAVIKLLGYGITGILGILGIIAAFVKILHNDMKKSIDAVHADLKPLTIQVAVHGEKIEELKDGQKEMNKWVGNHDGRIQNIERKVFANT